MWSFRPLDTAVSRNWGGPHVTNSHNDSQNRESALVEILSSCQRPLLRPFLPPPTPSAASGTISAPLESLAARASHAAGLELRTACPWLLDLTAACTSAVLLARENKEAPNISETNVCSHHHGRQRMSAHVELLPWFGFWGPGTFTELLRSYIQTLSQGPKQTDGPNQRTSARHQPQASRF